MKTTFTTDSNGRVTVSYDSDGERIARTFHCPLDGGYVIELVGHDWKQVCDRLSCFGSTLYCTSPAHLPAMIRREYRAMRRAEQKLVRADR